MALKIATPSVEPSKKESGLQIRLTTPTSSHPRDIPALLQQEAERWIDEHRETIAAAFSSLGSPVEEKLLKVTTNTVQLPNADGIESFLRNGRIPAVTFLPDDNGAFIITITSPDGREVLCPCNIHISFPHKALTATETSLIRTSLQMTLIKEANRKAAGLFEPHGAPAFVVWSDSDVQEATWSPEEQSQGFKIVRGDEAQLIYRTLPDKLRDGSQAVEPSALLLLTANKKASDEYRDALLGVVQEILSGPSIPLLKGVFRSLRQSPEHDPLTASLFTLIGSAMVEQDGRDPSGFAYQIRFGIDPDAIREKLNAATRAAKYRANDSMNGPAVQVRKTFADYLGDLSPHPELRGVLTGLQSAVLFALKKQGLSAASAAIDETLPKLPPDLQQELERLKATLEEGKS
jgi:hypothetical protein